MMSTRVSDGDSKTIEGMEIEPEKDEQMLAVAHVSILTPRKPEVCDGR